MIPRGGRTPYRGRGDRYGNIIASHGNRRLVAENLTSGDNISKDDPLYKEFMDFINKKNEESSSSFASYANIISKEEEDNITSYYKNDNKEVILLLEYKDLHWDNDPWVLMQRYLDTASYAVTSYKQRLYHENILKNMGCKISHFTSLNPNIYNLSLRIFPF